MDQLRKFLCGVFAISFLVCLEIAVKYTLRIIHHPQFLWHSRFLLVPAVFSILLFVYGVASWTIWANNRFGRAWGLAASSTYLLLPLSLMYFVHGRLPHFLVMPAIGIAGLFAFARRYETIDPKVRSQQSRKAPGDGTSELLNKAAPFLGLGLSLGIVSLVNRWARAKGVFEAHGSWYASISILLVILLIATLHELGHATVGLALGMKLRAFSAGPFQWRIRSGKWDFAFKPAEILAIGGATGVVPTAVNFPRSRFLAMIVAGPFVNLVTGLLALAVAFAVSPSSSVQAGGRLALFGEWSVGLCFFNLLPFKMGDSYSDGASIYQLLSQGPWGDLQRVAEVVGASLVTPLRPRDFDIDMILRTAQGITDGKQALLLRLYAYLCFLDRGKIPEAIQALKDAEAIYHKSASDIPTEFHSEFVFGNAYVGGDAVAAREWWRRMEAKKPTRFNEDYWRAYSALCLIEGRIEEANEAWKKCNALAQQLPAAGAYEFDRYCCSLLRKALDEASEGQ